jgi:hypothetical protein
MSRFLYQCYLHTDAVEGAEEEMEQALILITQ